MTLLCRTMTERRGFTRSPSRHVKPASFEPPDSCAKTACSRLSRTMTSDVPSNGNVARRVMDFVHLKRSTFPERRLIVRRPFMSRKFVSAGPVSLSSSLEASPTGPRPPARRAYRRPARSAASSDGGVRDNVRHPESEEALIEGRDEIEIGGGPISPRLHLATHEIVASQLWDDSPPEVWKTAARLLDAGYERHEILHMLGQPVSDQIWAALHAERPYDRDTTTPQAGPPESPGGAAAQSTAELDRSRATRGIPSAPERTRTSTDQSVHKALNLARLPIPPRARGRGV